MTNAAPELAPVPRAATRSSQPDATAPLPDGPPASAAADPLAGRGLYRVIWRWHFYAGLIVAPVLLVASLTGAALVFENELKQALWPARYVAASAGETRLPLREQVAAARRALGSDAGRLEGIQIGEWPRSTTLVTFERGATGTVVAVDPYGSAAQGVFASDDDPFHTLVTLHRTLLAGRFGRHVVELAMGWGVLLVLSGLYLWWPRGAGGGGWRGVLVPRLRGPLYTAIRDLHAVPGALAAVPLLVIFAGGFVFSATNGRVLQWHMARTGAMPAVFRDPPKSTPVPDAPPDAALDGVDRALALYQRPGWGLESSAPDGPTDSFNLFIVRHAHRTVDFDGVAVDQHTGAHLDHFSHVDATFSFDLMRYGYAMHTGSILGTPTKVLAVVTCLALAAASITGVAMWWARRPAARLGLPRRPGDARVPGVVAWGIVALGVLIPALGASVVLIVLGERLVSRRRRAAAA